MARRLGRPGTAGRILLLGLVLLLVGCSGGGDSGSLTPVNAPAALEDQATQNLVDLYCTAVLQEDSDRLQALLEGEGGAFAGSSFRDFMAGTFRQFAVTDLEFSTVAIQGTPTPMVVTFQEALSVVDQAGLAQRTQVWRTRWQLDRRVGTSGEVTMLIAAVAQEGPQFEVVIRGRVVAGLPTRVEVWEKTGTLPIVGGEVEVPETREVRELRPAGNHWHGIITAPPGPSPEALRLRRPRSCRRPGPSDDPGPSPKALRVRLRGLQGETIELQHRYHLQGPGEGIVQPVAGTGTTRFFAVAVTPDGTIWGGGDGGGTLVRVTPGATEVALVGQLLVEPDGRVEDLVVDALGRLHALVFAPHESRDIVFDPGIEHNPCPTVDVSHPAYPLLDGALRPSASVRTVAAGGGDLWLFGSDGGVARVADTFRGGVCPPGGAEVRYDPIFRRGESGLLSNSVPAFRVGADGALWFGTAVGLTRLVGQQFTPVLFDPGLSVQGDVATLEAFFQEVAKAIFEARPLTSGALGDVSFRQRFGRDLVKPDLIFSLAEDGQGRMWVGTLGGGLRRVEARSGVLQDSLLLTQMEGLASNLILALAVGPDGTVWVATEQGVSRIREVGGTLTIASFTTLDGLGVPVRDVVVAEDGTVWLGTDGGLFRIVTQGGVVRGVVIDSREQPVAGAEVVVVGTPFRAVTDATGRFVLVDLPLGPIRLEVDGRLAARGRFGSVVLDVVVSVGEQSTPSVMLPEPGSLVRVSGEGQVGRVGGRLPQPLVVAVRDSQGQPVPGILVTFRVLEGTGVVSPATIVTGADGQASTILTLGSVAGPNMVQAQVEGRGEVMFTASGIADRNTARLIIVSGNRQAGVPGEVLPEPLVVGLEDQFGNPVVREPVRAVIIQGEGTLQPAMLPLGSSGGALPLQSIDEQTHTDAQGRAAFRLQLGFSGESVAVEVRAASLPQVPPVQFLTVIGLISPRGIAVEASNSLVVVDSDLRAVVRVDPVKRSAAIVGDSTTGHDPPLLEPLAIAVEATGALVVVDGGLGAVLRVDQHTGERTTVSGCPAIDAEGRCVEEIIGLGPVFVFPKAIAVEATGALVVVDGELGAVLRVDQHTGERTTVSGCAAIDAEGRCVGGIIGGGFPFVLPEAMAVEATGALVVVDRGLGAVVRVAPHTGERTIVSGCPEIDAQGNCRGTLIGEDPPFHVPWGIAVEATGALLVGDAGLGAVMRLDPQTGKRTIVSGCAAIDAEGGCVGEPIGGGPPFDLPAVLAVEATGTLVVVDAGLGAVVQLDPHTGDRTIVRLGAGRGRGPRLDLPTDLAVEAAGSLVVTDAGLNAVMRVDPHTGDRTTVSRCPAIDTEGRCVGGGIDQGPPFVLPVALAVEATGALLVVDGGLGAVVRVDPHTGLRTIVSGCAAIDTERRCVGGIIGVGELFDRPAALAVEATGALVVVDAKLGAVLRVDSHTGNRTIVSGGPALDAQRICRGTVIGKGPPFCSPAAIAMAADGHLIVGDTLGQAVMRVDPHTGNRTIVSGCTAIDDDAHCVGGLIGGGPAFDFPVALAVEAAGSLVIVDPELDAVVRVDPGTGDREIVSDARIGPGLPLISPVAIAVEAAGSLVIIERKIDAVVRVDPHTGERAIVSVGAEGAE